MTISIISSTSLDELIDILDVHVYEEKYSRWVKNRTIRVCDIWDVIDDTLMMTVLDHHSDGDEIREAIIGVLHHLGKSTSIDAEDIDQAHEWASKYNESSGDVVLVGFGNSWDEADSVAVLALSAEQWGRIKGHPELSKLFYLI